MGKAQTNQQKIDNLQEFLVNPDRKYLFYDILWELMFFDLPDGYRLDDDGSIWLKLSERRWLRTTELILLCKK